MPTEITIPTKRESLLRDYQALGTMIKTLEDNHPMLLVREVKSNFGEMEVRTPEIANVIAEYRQLLTRRSAIEEEIRKIDGTDDGAPVVSACGAAY